MRGHDRAQQDMVYGHLKRRGWVLVTIVDEGHGSGTEVWEKPGADRMMYRPVPVGADRAGLIKKCRVHKISTGEHLGTGSPRDVVDL